MYISKVSNTWILNTQTFSLIICIDLSVLSTLYIAHTKPQLDTASSSFHYSGVGPEHNAASASTIEISVQSAVLAHPQQGVLLQVILFSVSQGCLNLNCWSTSCCSPPWWQVGSYIHYILYVNCAGFRYQTRLLFLAAASLWFGN